MACLMAPFLPHAAQAAIAMMGLDENALVWDCAAAALPAGHEIHEPKILFKKLDPPPA